MYDESTIQVLKGLEGVRKRPGMYVRGVDQLIWEAVDSALEVDATYVRIVIDGDVIAVEDDGESMPVVPLPTEPERTALEVRLTALHGGSCRARRTVRSGMHGMGLCIVNALSERCDVDAWWGGRHFQIGFARSVTVSPLRELGATNRRGMRVTFTPDFSILERAAWDREAIAARLRELAALYPHVTFIVDHDAIRCPDGIVDHARYLAGTSVAPVRHSIARDDVAVDVALAWCQRGTPIVASFVNTRALRIAGLDDGLWRDSAAAKLTHPATPKLTHLGLQFQTRQ